MAPKERKPKAKTENDRRKQAQALVLETAKERLPELSAADVEVFSATPAQGDGDWRAIVVIDGPERDVYMVGYNNETDTLFVDKLGRMA